jgi:galactokinase
MAGSTQILKTHILDRFRQVYPASPAPRIWRAPGRVNLIGEHTDYNMGLVLPMAIDLECVVASAPAEGDWFRVYSEPLAQGSQWRVADLTSVLPRGDWSDRVAGVAWELTRRGFAIAPQNVLIQSTVPLGGGLSSSAALGVAIAIALTGARPPMELTRIAHAAETDFVGVPCGIMDQFAAAHGVEGAALLLDCRTLEWKPIRLPDEVAIGVANTMVKHELGSSAYRTRVEECGRAARALAVTTLRDAATEMLPAISGVELKRARHVIGENARVLAFAQAASKHDFPGMGRLLLESHASLRDDYEVSSPELDFMVETAMGIPGVLGARMTGGGFGGCTVNLLDRSAVESWAAEMVRKYQEAYQITPEIHICTPSSGASEVFP